VKIVKRILLTFLAFIVGGVFIAIWREFVPSTSISGAVMALIAVGIVFGAWKWSERLK